MTLETESEAEARAWDEVVRAWGDEARHRAYLDGLAGLDGLAAAGRRYRAALEARPHDAVAAHWRDEVIRRATVAGLASLPREKPVDAGIARGVRIASLVLLGLSLAVALWAVVELLRKWSRP